MRLEDVKEDDLKEIIRIALTKGAASMGTERFNRLVDTISHNIYLHLTSCRKDDELDD